jgi:outer membrane protein
LEATKGAFYPRISMFGGLNSGYSSARQSVTGTSYVGLFPTSAVTQSGEAVLSPVYFTNTERTNFGDQLDQNFSKNFGLSLNIPIFNGLNTYSNVRQSRLSLENARISSELTRNQLFKSIQQAHTDAIAAQRKLAATEKAVVALQEAYMYAEKRFNAGLSNSLEFLTATNNLTRARIDSLQARYDLIFKVKVLDFYAGRPLAF